MFDFGIIELLLIAAVGLVIIGPQDLPSVLFKLGRAFRGIMLVFNRTRNQVADFMHDIEVEEYRKKYRKEDIAGVVEDSEAVENTQSPQKSTEKKDMP